MALQIARTLVLGIGSTGQQICEQLAEHLTWKYGDYHKAKWVGMLVIETETGDSAMLSDDNRLTVNIDGNDFSQYINNPTVAGQNFDYPKWGRPELLRNIDDISAGAGNIRMAGRLALYHNYDMVSQRIRNELSKLQNLNESDIAASLDDRNTTIQMYDRTFVYVVGTLCGGTCSGSCVDLGYLLKKWGGERNSCVGLFTIPTPDSISQRHKKNSFVALQEINHFMHPDNIWMQKLPDENNIYKGNGRPYNITYIVQPSGSGTNYIESANRTIADYLAAATGPAGFDVAGANVDGVNILETSKIIGYLKPSFSAMGIAALEYPAEHIQRAATDLLISGALKKWLSNDITGSEFKNARRLIGESDTEAFAKDLSPDIEDQYFLYLHDRLKNFNRSNKDSTDSVITLLNDIETKLRATANSDLPSLVIQMKKQKEEMLNGIQNRIDDCIDQYLLNIDGGPKFLTSLFNHFLSDVTTWETTLQILIEEQNDDLSVCRDNLNTRLYQLKEEIGKFILFRRRSKIERQWNTVPSLVDQYLQILIQMIRLQTIFNGGMLSDVIEQYKRSTLKAIERLNNMTDSFYQLAEKHEKEWSSRSSHTPAINGKVYYQARTQNEHGTCFKVYEDMLTDYKYRDMPNTGWSFDKKEKEAFDTVVKSLNKLMTDIKSNNSNFDRQPAIRQSIEMISSDIRSDIQTVAKHFFDTLYDREHIIRLASPNDINQMTSLSMPYLKVSSTLLPAHMAGQGTITPVDIRLSFVGSTDGNRNAWSTVSRQEIDDTKLKISNNLNLYKPVFDNQDPYRMMCVQLKHGLSIGHMMNVVNVNANDTGTLESAIKCDDFNYWNTRNDITWVNPLVSPVLVDKTEEDWLIFLLLGRRNEGAFSFLPDNNDDYYIYYNDSVRVKIENLNGQLNSEMSLPRLYYKAIASMLADNNNYHLLHNNCLMRNDQFITKNGSKKTVEALFSALDKLGIYNIDDLPRVKAENIVIRYCYRNSELEQAFFNMKFPVGMPVDSTMFSHIYRIQGRPKTTNPVEIYDQSGYYCKNDHFIDTELQPLVNSHFKCNLCNGDRIWP